MRRRHGFTLVELLVVISIIALLMGILMGTVNKVRTIAKRTTCKAGLHDLALGFRMYLDDSRNIMPPAAKFPWSVTDPLQKTGKSALVRFIGTYIGVSSAELAAETAQKKVYAKLLCCPGDRSLTDGTPKYFFKTQQSSYAYREDLGGRQLDKTAFRRSSKQADMEIMGDFEAFHGKKPKSEADKDSTVGSYNYLFADCHVGDRKGY